MRRMFYVFKKTCIVLFLFMGVLLLPSRVALADNEESTKCGRQEFQFRERENAENDRYSSGYVPSAEERAYWASFSNDYYLKQLSEGQRALWAALEAECMRFAAGNEDIDEVISVPFNIRELGVSAEEIKELAFIYYISNPQYYFLSNYYGYQSWGDYCSLYIGVYPEFCNGAVRSNATSTFCEKINRWCSEVAGAGRPEQKVRRAHDIIAANTVYNFGTFDQSAYSMVCEGQTVCAGYAAALQLLLNPNGIPAVTVTSWNHAWNLIKVHDQWYNLDVTWDDPDNDEYGPAIYNWYLKSNATFLSGEMGSSHIVENIWNGYLPTVQYDSVLANREYESSYFDDGGFVYFKVNSNQALASRFAAIIDMAENVTMDAALPWVSHQGSGYRVLGVAEGKRIVPHYDIRDVGGSWDGVQYSLPDGTIVKDAFFCDGHYTYYLMSDGTPMKDRLTYHPDGVNIIYFNEQGHEVFSDFANVRKSIAGDPVDDFCFFDVYGHLYVDVVTYDTTGKKLYYANPYGVLERDGWFQFSDSVSYYDGGERKPWEGAAGGYGYANEDGNLMRDTWTYDWQGRRCYMQGNGVALYE